MIDRHTYINDVVPEEEPVFILRAQDRFAPGIIRCWAVLVADAGNEAKAQEAYDLADEMDCWPTKKTPD